MYVWNDKKIENKHRTEIDLYNINNLKETQKNSLQVLGIEFDNQAIKTTSEASDERILFSNRTLKKTSKNLPIVLADKNIKKIKIKGKQNNDSPFEKIIEVDEKGFLTENWPENVVLSEVNYAVDAVSLYKKNGYPIFKTAVDFMTSLEKNNTSMQIFDLDNYNNSKIKTIQNPYYFIGNNRVSGKGFYNKQKDATSFRYIETKFKNHSSSSTDTPLLSLLGSEPELIYQNFDHIRTNSDIRKIEIVRYRDDLYKIKINNKEDYFNPLRDEIIFLTREAANNNEVIYENKSRSNLYKVVYSQFTNPDEAKLYDYYSNSDISFVQNIINYNGQDLEYCRNGCYTSFSAPAKSYHLTINLRKPKIFILNNNITTSETTLKDFLSYSHNVSQTNNYDFLYSTTDSRSFSIESDNVSSAYLEYIYDSNLELGAQIAVSRSWVELTLKNMTFPYKIIDPYNFSFRLICDLSLCNIENVSSNTISGIGTVLINEFRTSYGILSTSYVSNNSENSLFYNGGKDVAYRIFQRNGVKPVRRGVYESTFKDSWTYDQNWYPVSNYFKPESKSIIAKGRTDRLVWNYQYNKIQKRGKTNISLVTQDKFSCMNVTTMDEGTKSYYFWYNDVFIANPNISYIDASEEQRIATSSSTYVDFPYNDNNPYTKESTAYAIYIIRNQKIK